MEFSTATPIFVDTNLGTKLALPAPPDTTVGELKRKLEQAHFSCFPGLGEIKVHALLVKRKTYFYSLADSMPIKCVWQGFVGTWLLHMDASRLEDISRQKATSTSLENHCTRQGSCCERIFVQQNCEISPVSQNLTTNNSQGDQNRSGEIVDLQGIITQEMDHSMSDVSDVTECSILENKTRYGDLNLGNQACKSGRDLSICNEEQLDVLSSPNLSRKGRLRRTGGQDNPRNIGGGSVNDNMEEILISAKKTRTSELASCLNPEKEEQTKDNIVMHESLGVYQRGKNRSHVSSLSVRETSNGSLSHKMSVTALISRYFCDYDEVNSSRTVQKNMQNKEKMTQQFSDVLKFEEAEQNEIARFSAEQNEIARFSANDVEIFVDRTSFKRIESEADTVSSLNINASDGLQFEHDPAKPNHQQRHKNEQTACSSKSQRMGIFGEMENATSFVVSDEHSVCHTDKEKSARIKVNRSENKACRSRRRVNKKVVCDSHQSTSKMSLWSFDKPMVASYSKIDRIAIGKRLIQAANNICSTSSGKKSSNFMFKSRSGNLLIPRSSVPFRSSPFEISDSDG